MGAVFLRPFKKEISMKIGITERGDASIDYSWVEKLKNVDGAILITKNITSRFIKEVLEQKDKIIVHCTCTGYGGTELEPNVPPYSQQLNMCKKLCDMGFPMEKVVIRIDPIIPSRTEHYEAFSAAHNMGFRRFRFSVIDMYPHVRVRFKENGVPLPYGKNFAPDVNAKQAVLNFLDWTRAKYGYDFQMETCAESWLAGDDGWGRCSMIGCVSEADLTLLGIDCDRQIPVGHQRKGCLCLSCKTELLSEKKRCPYQCLYCFWKDE